MSPLFLYPALSGRGGGKGDEGHNFVFRNGDRLKLPEEPNTTGNQYFKNFTRPCYRIPSLLILDSGRIIVGSDYRKDPKDQVAILPAISYSDDNGKTWKKQILGNPPFTSLSNDFARCMDQTIFLDAQNRIHVLCGFWNGSNNNVNWTATVNDSTFSLVEFVSEDGGETWTTKTDFRRRTDDKGQLREKSWLGGVGNCVVTKQGTTIVPIQWSPSPNRVNASFIYSNDGINWEKFAGNMTDMSETSVSSWINTSGKTELLFISRRDGPGVVANKAAYYVTQNTDGSFAGTTFTTYGTYDSKIPARHKGCQGSQICNSGKTGNYGTRINVMVSYAKNLFGTINAYERDNIVVAGFGWANYSQNTSRPLRDIEMINSNVGAEEAGIPYGGYSVMYYNHTARKMGIAYENMLGVCYKDLSHLIPQFLGEPAA